MGTRRKGPAFDGENGLGSNSSRNRRSMWVVSQTDNDDMTQGQIPVLKARRAICWEQWNNKLG